MSCDEGTQSVADGRQIVRLVCVEKGIKASDRVQVERDFNAVMPVDEGEDLAALTGFKPGLQVILKRDWPETENRVKFAG
jgi:hypothetical protein